MDAQSVLQLLSKARFSPDKLPDRPGLYAFWASESAWAELGLEPFDESRPLYVGKSESSLQDRDFKTHFRDGRTGTSTLRRSLAALLGVNAKFSARPRNLRPRQKFSHFKLRDQDEAELSRWMRQNLKIGVWCPESGVSLGEIEKAVVKRCNPPLNLNLGRNPWRKKIMRYRKSMATQARIWLEKRREFPAPQIVSFGVALGQPVPECLPDCVAIAVEETGQRSIALVASELIVEGKKYRAGSELEPSDIPTKPGSRCWWPFFQNGEFAGLFLDHCHFVLFYKLERSLRLRAVYAEMLNLVGTSADQDSKSQLYQTGLRKRLGCVPTRWPIPEQRPHHREISCMGVQVGMSRGEFEEPSETDIVYSAITEEVIGVAGNQFEIDGVKIKAGDTLSELVMQWGLQSVALQVVGDDIIGLLLVFSGFHLQFRVSSGRLKFEFALLGTFFEKSHDPKVSAEIQRRAEEFHRALEPRFTERSADGE